MDNYDYKAMNQSINSEAKKLSTTYNLDKKRIVKVLQKLAEINWYDADYAVYSELEKAFQYLSPYDALELFEKEDLTRLATRVLLVEYLNAHTTPFYTLDKLADLTKEFIDHLQENKDHLLKTGYPETIFEKSLWLDKHLNKLYFVKIPAVVHEIFLPSLGCIKNSLKILYSWSGKTVDHNKINSQIINNIIEEIKLNSGRRNNNSRLGNDLLSLELKARLKKIGLNLNEYEVAPLIQGLTEEDSVKIEDLRRKLYDLKVGVLEKLYDAAISTSKYKLITDCVKIIHKYLTAEEINFLIEKDYFYTNMVYGERTSYSNNGSSLICHNAGLSDLFMVIGHFYKEIELSTMDEYYKSLEEIPDKQIPKSYYKAIGKPWQDDLNQILHFYLSLEGRDNTFWTRYKHQINNMFSLGSLGHSNNVCVSLLQMDTEPIYMDIKSFVAQYDKDDSFKQIINDGKRAIVLLSEIPPKKAIKSSGVECIYRKMGKGWYIYYKGKEAFFKDYIGFNYIEIVLSKQTEKFGALELYQIVKKHPRTSSSLDKMTEIELQNEGLSKAGGTKEKIIDRKAVKEFKEKLEDFAERIDEAMINGDHEKADSLKKEKEEFIKWLQTEYGDEYKRKSMNIDYKRSRDAVSNAIRRAIKVIDSEIPELAKHLKLYIKTGNQIVYTPTEQIHWVTIPPNLN